jgi:hypothetical protein
MNVNDLGTCDRIAVRGVPAVNGEGLKGRHLSRSKSTR